MLKTLKFSFVLLLMLGCKREYAYFQKTTTEDFQKPKKKIEKTLSIEEELLAKESELILLPTMTEVEDMVAEISMSVPTGNNQAIEKTDLFPKRLFKKKNQVSSKDNNRRIFKEPEKKGIFAKKKKKKRRDGFWHGFNERLKIGLVLLGIAIIFALLHINILAIIFGLLSAFFIIRGLKKLF